MHLRFVLRQLGFLLVVFSAAMLFSAAWAIHDARRPEAGPESGAFSVHSK